MLTFYKRWGKAALIVGLIAIPLAAYAAIVPKNMRAIDSPADEECMTYESDNNAFEWQSCVATSLSGDLTLENLEFIDNGTNGVINLGRNNSGTVTLGSLDDDTTADLTINPGGTATLTLGGSPDTVTVAATTGLTLGNSERFDAETDATFTFVRNDAGIVTFTCADNDATAGCTYDAGGAAPIVVGSADVTAVTVTTDDTGTAELVAPVNSVGPTELSVHTEELIFCGQNAENGTIYFGPNTATFNGDGVDTTLASAACDALDNATEATADAPISALASKIHGMRCKLNGTLGAGETLDFTLRTAEGNAVTTDGAATTITCSMAVGDTECRVNTSTTTNIGANATLAMQVIQSSNNADDDAWCSVTVSFP